MCGEIACNAEGSPLENGDGGGGTSLGLEQDYQWELGPRKDPLLLVNVMDGAGGEMESWEGRTVGVEQRAASWRESKSTCRDGWIPNSRRAGLSLLLTTQATS